MTELDKVKIKKLKNLIVNKENYPDSLKKIIKLNKYEFLDFKETKNNLYNIFSDRHEICKHDENYKNEFLMILEEVKNCKTEIIIGIMFFSKSDKTKQYALYCDSEFKNAFLLFYGEDNIATYCFGNIVFKFNFS